MAQNQPANTEVKGSYDKKEEILFDNKRYRKYNNYLTGGAGYAGSTLRTQVQKVVGADFHFHIRKQYFMAGLLMSGEEFLSNNNVQFHACYGIREEKNLSNITIFAGPSVFTGVEGTPGISAPTYYQGIGAYFCFEGIIKFKYDIGLGVDVFAELSPKQNLGGLKFIFFFSSAYRGLKGNYNPHVKSENRR
jgi:hypothetical protein